MAFKSFDDIRKVVLKRSESFGFGSGYDGPEDIKSSNPEYIKKQREKQGNVNFNENKTITQTSSEPKIRRKAFDSSNGYKYNNIFDIYKGLKNANKSSSKREPFKPVNNEYKYNSVIDLLKQPAIYDMPKSKIEDIYLKTYFANSFDDYEPSKNSFEELTKGYVPKTSEQKRNYEKALLEDRANRKLGEDNKLLGILGYLGASFNSGVAYGDTVGNALFNREADPYSEAYQAARAASSIKEGLLSDIESKPGRFLAETGLSMLENASRFALKPTGAAISLGLTTGGQKATSELLKGVDTSSAAKSATVSAAIETVTEKIPLDNLYKVYKTAGKTGVRNAVKTVLKQAGIEATEESISNITNVLSDRLILKDKSDYEIYKNELIKSGMNEKEAEREATKKFLLIDTLFSAAGGALSGGVFGSVGVAGAKIRTNNELKKRDAKLKEGILPKNSVSSEVSDNSNDLQLVRGNDGVLYLTSDPLSVNNLTKKSDGIYYENTETLKNNADLGIDYNNKKLSDYVKENNIIDNNNLNNPLYDNAIKTDQELADVIGAKEANKILNLIQHRPDLELFSDLVDAGIYPTVKKGTAAYDYIEQLIKKRLNESIYDFRVKTENFAKDRDFVLNETLNSEINDILNEFGVLTDDNYYKFTDNLKNLSEIMTPGEIHDYVPVLNYEIDGSYEVAKNVMKYISEPLNRRQNAKNLIEAVKKFKDDGKNFDIKQSILTGAEVDLFQPFKSNSRYLSDLNTVLNDKLKQYPYYLKKIVKDKFMSEFRMEELKAEAFENYKKATTEKEKNDILNLLKFHLNEANDFSKYSFIKESIFDIGHTPVDFIEIENKLNYLKNKLNNNPDYINFSNELNKPENIKAKRRFKDFLNDEIDFKELVPNKYSFLNKAPANFFEISKEIQDLKSIKSAHRREVMNTYKEEAEFNIENSDNWYDLSNLSYKTDTGIRNSFKIMPTTKEAEAFNEYYFKQVQKNEADSIRFKKQLIDEIKSLNLSDKKKYDISIKFKGDSLPTDLKVSESGLVQLLGEKRITLDDIKRVGADSDKILNSVNTIRDIYNRIYVLLNDTLIRNGLDPVPFRKDYFPHFNEKDDLLNVIASNFGLEVLNIELPTNISGLTHMFSPNRQFSGHLTERKGDYTDFDVLKGIDRYLPAVSNIIFHTDDVQRFKALEKALRDKHSPTDIDAEMKKIIADEYLSPEEKLSKLDELRNRDLTHLNNFVKEINRYVTVLTGKKSLVDRALEDAFSRKAYSVFGRLSNYVGSGMVGFNVSSAFTNFIPITQALSDVSGVNMLKGIKDTLTGRSLEDGLSERSDFLVRRKGHDLLSPNNFRKITDKGFLLMTALDNFASESIVRAKLYDNFKKGMDYESALKDADAFASEVMADRSFGSLPTIYSEKNPLTKAFTMFQLEVKNQYGYMFHDLPRRKQEEGLAVLAYSLLKMFLGAYLFNDIYEKISGRRAALDPLSTLNGLVGDLAGVQVKNSVDIFNDYLSGSSDNVFLKPVTKKRGIEAAYDLGKEVISEIPFVGTLAGGGRIPTLAFFPDSAKNLIKYSDPEVSAEKRKEALTEEALNLLYLVPGGGQLKKSIQGYNVLKNGGLYTYDSDGNKKLKFPVEKITPFKTVQGLTFGRWSFPEAVKNINGEIKSLSVSKTDYWEKAKKNGINYFDFYKAIEITKDVLADKDSKGNSVPNSSSIKKKYLIDSNFKNLNAKQKEILYKTVGISDTVINGKKGDK